MRPTHKMVGFGQNDGPMFEDAGVSTTTVGNITFPHPSEGLLDLVGRTEEAGSQAPVDFFLHPVLLDLPEDTLAELPDLARSGQTSVKIFMGLGTFDGRSSEYLNAMRIADESGMLSVVHQVLFGVRERPVQGEKRRQERSAGRRQCHKKCENYAKANNFENVDVLPDRMIQEGEFAALVVIDDPQDKLDSVLSRKFKFGVEVFTRG